MVVPVACWAIGSGHPQFGSVREQAVVVLFRGRTLYLQSLRSSAKVPASAEVVQGLHLLLNGSLWPAPSLGFDNSPQGGLVRPVGDEITHSFGSIIFRDLQAITHGRTVLGVVDVLEEAAESGRPVKRLHGPEPVNAGPV